MPAIEWTKKLSVGIDRIDQQHQELISRLNKLITAMKSGRAKAEVLDLIEFLERYVFEHFKLEEDYMNECQFPQDEFEDHQNAHHAFIRELHSKKLYFLEYGATSSFVINLQIALTEWLYDHIGQTDLTMAAYFKECAFDQQIK